MSGIVNKIKETLSSDTHHTGSAEGTHGPHASRAANAADPRVDSDRDGSHTVGNTGNYGSHGTTGPHSSNLANKADPRVDSDRDGSHTTGGTGTHGHGVTGSHGTHGTTGPHSSNLANKADPRVDSDRDGSHTIGGAGTGYQSTQFGDHHKKHSSEAYGGEYGQGHSTTGVMPVGASGVGAAVAPGPNVHKSELLNKLDPRVDTHGTHGKHGTHGSHGVTEYEGKDPTDASQVPPSVLREHIGHPTIEHDDHTHERARRNSTATHQEAHRGL